MPGTVLAVEMDGVMAKIDLACGPYRIVSLMSREAAETSGSSLGLRRGRRQVDDGDRRASLSLSSPWGRGSRAGRA